MSGKHVEDWGAGGPCSKRTLDFYNVHLEAGVLTTTDGPRVTAYLTKPYMYILGGKYCISYSQQY